MDTLSTFPNQILIQGLTPKDLENLIDRVLEKRLSSLPINQPAEEKSKDGLINRKEAACMLRVTTVTLDNWTKLGLITARRVGGRIYYTQKDIDEALKKVSKR